MDTAISLPASKYVHLEDEQRIGLETYLEIDGWTDTV